MSRLKISPNLFLEVNELNRLVKFMDEDGYKRAFKALIDSFGIVENASNNFFKTTIKPGSSDVVIVNSGLAFDSAMNAIILENNLEMTVENTGENRWLVLSRAVSNFEKGKVSINLDGTLTGLSTEFTKVLRGQPNFPVKIKFQSLLNTNEYEVVRVISDTSAIISGNFVAEADLSYSVIGTFTPGYQADEDYKNIYEYDSCDIRIVDSSDTPVIGTDEYILCKITFDISGGMNVTDKRYSYMFNSTFNRTSDNYNNPLTSLLNVGVVGGIKSEGSSLCDFELIIEHGYKINEYEFITNSSSNLFNIISGNCNYLGAGNIPNDMFKDWLLLNRANMKYAVINSNENKTLVINNFDSSIIELNNNDFIIVPNFKEIEYEVKVSSNVYMSSAPFYFKMSIQNLKNRLRFYSFFPGSVSEFSELINVKIRYRMVNSSEQFYPFSDLSVSQFINVNGQTETLSESSFDVDLSNIEPQEKQRNYS